MRAYLRIDVSDEALSSRILVSNTEESRATASFVADIAEFDARKLFVPKGHPSMHSYCVHVLNLSPDAAYKRIQVARKAREIPSLYVALEDRSLNLSGARLLAPYLTPENADELLTASRRKTGPEIEELLALRFPRTESMPLVETSHTSPPAAAPESVQETTCILAARQVGSTSKVTPIAPERFDLHLSMGRVLRDKLQLAQELGSHAIAPGDYEALIDVMADAYIAQEKKRKFGSEKRRRIRPASAKRTIPVHVRKAVWQRDAGQCTYCNEHGQRCPARTRLEFDHILPVARGGEATMDNIRLRCRAHNQLAAEQAFGKGFMENKRQEAKQAAVAQDDTAKKETSQGDRDIVPWLRALGIKTDQARHLAATCDDIPDAPIEERIRRALSHHGARLAYRGGIAARHGA